MDIVKQLMLASGVAHIHCMDCHNSRVSSDNLSLYPIGPGIEDWRCGDCLDDYNGVEDESP